MDSITNQASLHSIRTCVESLRDERNCSEKILEALWDNDSFCFHENSLWDFKLKSNAVISLQRTDEHKDSTIEITKDIVSFHNTNGGYLIFGIDDKSKK